MKNFLIKISVLCAILSLSFPFEMSAQTYEGTFLNRECTLDLSQHKSEGYVAFDDNDMEMKSYPDMKEIDCEGTFEIYMMGMEVFNLLKLKYTSDVDGSEHYLAISQEAQSPDKAIEISIKYGPGRKTVFVSEVSKDPLFKNVKLTLVK